MHDTVLWYHVEGNFIAKRLVWQLICGKLLIDGLKTTQNGNTALAMCMRSVSVVAN